MSDIHDLSLFIIAGLLLNVTPGPDTLYIVGRSVTQGRLAGVVSALGIGAGCMIHIFAAAFGLSAILASSALAFSIVKYAGAVYLIYLGARALWPATRKIASSAPALSAATHRTIFRQAFLTNVLNPKVALFFVAFLPQFVDGGATTRVLPFLVLGLIFNFNGTLWNLFVAWSAASLGATMRGSQPLANWLNRLTGAMFITLGVKLAITER